jgi:hypothetical protein
MTGFMKKSWDSRKGKFQRADPCNCQGMGFNLDFLNQK